MELLKTANSMCLFTFTENHVLKLIKKSILSMARWSSKLNCKILYIKKTYSGSKRLNSDTAVEIKRRRTMVPIPQVSKAWVSNPNPALTPNLHKIGFKVGNK